MIGYMFSIFLIFQTTLKHIIILYLQIEQDCVIQKNHNGIYMN